MSDEYTIDGRVLRRSDGAGWVIDSEFGLLFVSELVADHTALTKQLAEVTAQLEYERMTPTERTEYLRDLPTEQSIDDKEFCLIHHCPSVKYCREHGCKNPIPDSEGDES